MSPAKRGRKIAVFFVRGTTTSGNTIHCTYCPLSLPEYSKPVYSNPPSGRSAILAVTVKSSPHSGWPFHVAVTTFPFVATESDFIFPCVTETVGANARSEPTPPDVLASFASRHSPSPSVKPTRMSPMLTSVGAPARLSAAFAAVGSVAPAITAAAHMATAPFNCIIFERM